MTQPQVTGARRRSAPVTTAGPGDHLHHDESDHAAGWLVFAAAVLAVVGALNGIYGTAAIATSAFYATDTAYVLGSLELFGWLMLVLGVVQFCASLGILAFTQWARWVGIAAAGANAIVQLLVMPAAPLLSVGLLVVDVLVVYALVAYGWRAR